MATPIRKKSLWQNHDFVLHMLELQEASIQMLPPHKRPEFEARVEEGYRDLESLRVRAERLEGVRHG